MNTDTGEFVEEKHAQEYMSRIAINEVVKIEGKTGQLRVLSFTERTVTLELMSAQDRLAARFDIASRGTPANRHERRAREVDLRKLR